MTTAAVAGLASAATREVAARVRESGARGRPLRPRGAGSWMDAGRPVRGDAEPLALDGDAGIVEYVPGDLTMTARAGTPLAAIARVTDAEGQWLPLDPPGDAAGTIGATVATASAGPLALAFGTPRDLVLGLEFVSGRGEVVRGGGRVVKNVAGFDLVRLQTGAWGTLGVLTEVSLRLRARAETERTVAVSLPSGRLPEWLARLRAAPLEPWALQLVTAPLAARLGLEARPLLLARLGGNAPLVAAQAVTLASLGDARDVAGDVWQALRGIDGPGVPVLRLSAGPAALADVWAHAGRLADRLPGTLIHADAGRGIVRVVVPRGTSAAALGRTVEHPPFTGVLVAERLPAPLWPVLAPTRVTDPLSRRVREAFDPAVLLNPGILGETPAAA